MDQQRVPLAAQALVAMLWDLTTVVGKLGRETSAPVRLDRGVPQGAPESPVIFTMVVEMVLRRVMDMWRARGAGLMMDGVWNCCVCYADDLVLLARSPYMLEGMCADLIVEFRRIGLGVGAEKTHWTSAPRRPGEELQVDGCRVAWEASFTYVGNVIHMTGSAEPAMLFRMGKAISKQAGAMENHSVCAVVAPSQARRFDGEGSVVVSLVVRADLEPHQSTVGKTGVLGSSRHDEGAQGTPSL